MTDQKVQGAGGGRPEVRRRRDIHARSGEALIAQPGRALNRFCPAAPGGGLGGTTAVFIGFAAWQFLGHSLQLLTFRVDPEQQGVVLRFLVKCTGQPQPGLNFRPPSRWKCLNTNQLHA